MNEKLLGFATFIDDDVNRALRTGEWRKGEIDYGCLVILSAVSKTFIDWRARTRDFESRFRKDKIGDMGLLKQWLYLSGRMC